MWIFWLACKTDDVGLERYPEGTQAGDCSDAADNDQDGFFDCEDVGCEGSSDCFEADADTDTDADTDADADTDPSLATGPARIEAEEAGSGLGDAVQAVDVDLDGEREVLVGAPRDDAGGSLWVFAGPATGVLTTSDAAARLTGGDAGDRFGSAVAVGDWESDGERDLLVGAPDADDGGRDAGAVYLAAPESASALDLPLVLYGTDGSGAGATIVWGSDLDADGSKDFIVGAPDGSVAWLVGARPTTGRSLDDVAWLEMTGHEGETGFGSGIAAEYDLDADGTDDVAVAAPGDDLAGDRAGAIFVFSHPGGGAVDADDADVTVVGGASGDQMGAALLSPGDVDGDGDDDLVVGAPGGDDAGLDAGAVYLFTGPLTGQIEASAATSVVLGASPGDAFGTACAMDSGELGVGAPGSHDGAGGLYVLADWETGTTTAWRGVYEGDGAGTVVAAGGGGEWWVTGGGVIWAIGGQ
jgi:hypothetical protein